MRTFVRKRCVLPFLLAIACTGEPAARAEAQVAPTGFVRVPGATFERGVGAARGPRVRVEDFEILDHPVTNREYQVFVDATGHPAPQHWKDGRIPGGKEEHPVIFVNRQDVQAYLDWLTRSEKRVYRLPTSVEFEHAARGGEPGRTYSWGDAPPAGRANFDADRTRRFDEWATHLQPARSGRPNGYGLYGMAGNVSQMVVGNHDRAVSTFKFRIREQYQLENSVMGGSWARGPEHLRAGARFGQPPMARHPDLGFRPVRQPEGSDWNTAHRSLAALPRGRGSVIVGWALLPGDAPGTSFHVYRSTDREHAGFRVNAAPVHGTTTVVDTGLVAGRRYHYYVRSVAPSGKEGAASEWVGVNAADSATAVLASFRPLVRNGGSLVPIFGDLDGDGRRDAVIRLDNGIRETTQDPGDPVQIEAFTSYGRSLWRRDLSDHERAFGNANNIPFAVWDMDGDARAEVITRMQFGDSMRIVILDGITGRLEHSAAWPEMVGDDFRSSTRVHLSIAYLDGQTPAVVTQTGLYSNEILAAYDASLRPLWRYDSFGETSGSGSHRIEVADVDGDGRQEVFDGTTCLNHDGTLRWSIYRMHPDLVSIRDFLPDRPGLEVFYAVETSLHAGVYMVDANDGEIIWKMNREDDPRWTHAHIAWTADIWSGAPGIEAVSNRAGHNDHTMVLFSPDGRIMMEPFPFGYKPLEWDGDATRELIHEARLEMGNFDGKSIVDVPGRPAFAPGAALMMAADLYGDFRDEIVLQVKDPETGRNRVEVVTAVEPIARRFLAPSSNRDYALWLARNMGGGYRSVYDQPLMEPK